MSAHEMLILVMAIFAVLGYYPIIKPAFEKTKMPNLCKYLFFNSVILAVYWLLINLGGTWRHIDPTPSSVHSIYSLMTDAQRKSTLSGRDWDRSGWPVCE